MSLGPQLRAALQLTRPRQWPILSFQLAVGMGLAWPADPGGAPLAGALAWPLLAASWLVWVVLLNGGTLAFNSAYDRDTEAVAYLAAPPPPPAWLAGAALGAMAAGVLLGWWLIGRVFGLLTAACTLLSWCYSHPRSRWKAVPGLDLLVNMAGYGAGTTLAGLLAGHAAGLNGNPAAGALVQALAQGGGWFVAGFGCLFGSLYPLTQLYQMRSDRQRGDRTLAVALGLRPSLVLAWALGLLAAACLLLGLLAADRPDRLLPPAVACLLWLLHLVWWWVRAPGMADPDHARGMYRALALWAVVDVALLLAWWL